MPHVSCAVASACVRRRCVDAAGSPSLRSAGTLVARTPPQRQTRSKSAHDFLALSRNASSHFVVRADLNGKARGVEIHGGHATCANHARLAGRVQISFAVPTRLAFSAMRRTYRWRGVSPAGVAWSCSTCWRSIGSASARVVFLARRAQAASQQDAMPSSIADSCLFLPFPRRALAPVGGVRRPLLWLLSSAIGPIPRRPHRGRQTSGTRVRSCEMSPGSAPSMRKALGARWGCRRRW